MRLSISCEWCRLSKVKCIHSGQPPCRRCQRMGRDSCALTDSRAKRTPRASRHMPSVSPTIPSPVDPPSSPAPDNPITRLSAATIINACDLYRRKFPIANFIHYPSLISDIASSPSSVDPVFVAALLSLCARFMPDHHGLEAGETYAEYARTQLGRRAFDGPSLHLAQSLIMISFYEWGSGRPYKAWMYSGMATYMVQSLLKTADDSMEHNPEEFNASQVQYEGLIRTFWVCFGQDCELSSGARQHFALSFREISVPLPISDKDFIFGQNLDRRVLPKNMNTTHLTIDHGLTIVTRGFDIFVRILRFANENRRGRASAAPPHRTWEMLMGELNEWRSLQDSTVRFPETSAQVHVSLGLGEIFGYVNLVYFMSVLFLCRDRLLSHPKLTELPIEQTPQTAFDYDDALESLFQSAQKIGELLSALELSGAAVFTPYAGFSVFVVAHISMYGSVCFQKYPGGKERAELEKKANFAYLERLCQLWPVGHTWWRTVQEANRFYEMAKGNQGQSAAGRPGHLTLAGTLDEYGDIRCARPESSPNVRRRRGVTISDDDRIIPRPANAAQSSIEDPVTFDFHELEADMLQWPFIDETWTSGFDTGFDAAWSSLG